MASIAKRTDGRWRARYRDDAGKEHARHFDRKIDAQRWLDEVTAAQVTGTYCDPDAGKLTFAAWFAEWSDRQVWVRGTQLSAQQAADSATFGSVPMTSIKPSHLQQWIKTMDRRGLAPTTIRSRANYVHAAFRGAVADRIIPADPMVGLALPRLRRQAAAMAIPTPEQVGQALEAAGSFQPFVAVCAFAGLRLGEAAGLQVGDVDFLRRTVTIHRQVQGENPGVTEVVPPKYGSERVIFVPAELIELLAAHIQRNELQTGDWIFTGRDGGPLRRNQAGHQWRRIRRAVAGLGDHTLHDLRHFYASGLIAAGCDVVTVQRALGHSSASITLTTYSHLWPTAEDRTRAAAGALMAEVRGDSDHAADYGRTGGLQRGSDVQK